MSYSFTVRAKTKDEAKAEVAEKFDTVVNSQPTHQVDRVAVVAATGAFLDMIAAPEEGDEVYVAVNGSLSWASEGVYTSANVNIQTTIRKPI